jgi:formylglycine-generating enzyme required for sulfatase activity
VRLQCPNCLCDLEVVASDPSVEVKCPSCGSQVDVGSHLETTVYVAPRLGRFGPFELVERIGRGHFGEVFKAKDLRLERVVAVKVPRIGDLSEAEAEAFRHEARTAARLRHPNIVTVHEVGSVGDTVYIASELIDGVNLADLMAGRRMQSRKAAEVAATVAEALDHAHQHAVVHRDLKPRNIMLDESGVPHLLDFGLAKQLTSEFTITTDGDILGTPAYMSPEQARGESSKADARTDVYSLGVTLFEMLTGQRPFNSHARGLIYQILHEDPPLPRQLAPEVPRDLETICLKAMSKSPAARYATAGEMAADLRRYLAGEPITARRAGPVERGWRWCCRNPALSAAGSLATVATLALGILTYAYATSETGPPKREVQIDVKLAAGPYQHSSNPQATGPVRLVAWPLDREGNPVVTAPVPTTGRPPLRLRLAPGDYFVVAVDQPSGRFHEVFRRVPRAEDIGSGIYRHERWDELPGQVIKLADISLPLAAVGEGMVLLAGSDDFLMGHESSPELPIHHRRVPPFLLDAREITMADYSRSTQFVVDEAVQSTDFDAAVTHVKFDQAAAWAEHAGKRLPTETMYEYAATKGGGALFPWGDNPPPEDWQFGTSAVASYDKFDSQPPLVGLYSNVAEWTSTWMQFYPRAKAEGATVPLEPREYRVVRGAPATVIEGIADRRDWPLGPRNRTFLPRSQSKDTVGFRCARSARPHLTAADFESVVRDGR